MTTPYLVTQITEQYGVDPTGKLIPYQVVYYKTAYGDTGSVKLPKDQYSGELARSMIEDEVMQHDAARKMT